jgi:hypothetical protein
VLERLPLAPANRSKDDVAPVELELVEAEGWGVDESAYRASRVGSPFTNLSQQRRSTNREESALHLRHGVVKVHSTRGVHVSSSDEQREGESKAEDLAAS